MASSPAPPVGTLESRYADRLQEFRAQRADDGAPADAEIEYMLDAMPFIREYSSTTPVEDRARPALGPLGSFVAVTHTSNRNNVLQRYLIHVEKRVDATTMAAVTSHGDAGAARNPREAEYFCEKCDVGMTFHARESTLVCPQCGKCRSFTEMNERNLTYDEEVNRDVVTYFAYKRLNHFCEWLNSLQAKENTEIPHTVVDAVKAEFKKTRTTTRAEIKPTKVREFLKKLKLNK